METVNEKDVDDSAIFSVRNYNTIAEIGSGKFGKTFHALDTTNNNEVILKFIDSKHIWNKIYEKRDLLISFPEDSNMPQIIDIFELDNHKCIVEELLPGTTLSNIIPANTLTYDNFFSIIENIINALSILHKYDFIHGDIKPSNIIINQDTITAYLIDIDSIFYHEFGHQHFFGTLAYAAPEQILDNTYSTTSDIYSLGILMYHILKNDLPFTMDNNGMLDKINNKISFSISDICNVSFKDELQSLITKMTDIERIQRPSLDDILHTIKIIKEKANKYGELDLVLRSNPPKQSRTKHRLSIQTERYPTFLSSVVLETVVSPSLMITSDSVSYFNDNYEDIDKIFDHIEQQLEVNKNHELCEKNKV